VTNSYCFEKHATADLYTIDATLKTGLNRFVDSESASLRIKRRSNIVTEKSSQFTAMAQIKTIKVRNDGNIVEGSFFVTDSVSEFTSNFFYPQTIPASSEKIDGKVMYRWIVEGLEPEQETEIKYEIRYFSIWFTSLAIFIVVFLAFTYVYRPRIRKTFNFIGPLAKGKEVSILLEVKNSTLHEVKNITVKDTITSIAQLVRKFDTVKPEIKKTDAGTELEWRIKSLQPLEERVLTYRIKPVIDIIGSMRLPNATMSFTGKKKERRTMASNSVEVK
jgi:hypothetical protein